MALKKITVWKVILQGEVEVEAVSGDEALAKARALFLPLHDNVTWSLESHDVYVEGSS